MIKRPGVGPGGGTFASWILLWPWSWIRVVIVAAMAIVERRAMGNSMLPEAKKNDAVGIVFWNLNKRLDVYIRFRYPRAKIWRCEVETVR